MSDVRSETSPTPSKSASTEGFPEAKIVPKGRTLSTLFRSSRMWWVAVLCLIVAVTLTWISMEPKGTEILIHFPEGHGLHQGDTVRFRGINVGHVDDVTLNKNLKGVDAAVTLTPEASSLARKGTRFWIVRPELSLTEIKGLETAIGGKYIAVDPGHPASEPEFEFEGLTESPADGLSSGGIEIVLRSERSHGIAAGAPVLWRGVEVGRVLSVDLAMDTRFVDLIARVSPKYQRLVRSNSRFWVSSGVDISAGFSGLQVKTESLTTMAKGGISFTTPAVDGEAAVVETGHVFELHAAPEDDWQDPKKTASFFDFQAPPTLLIRVVWRKKFLGISSEASRLFSGLPIDTAIPAKAQIQIVVPAEAMATKTGAVAESWTLDVVDPATGEVIASSTDPELVSETETGLALIAFESTAETRRGVRGKDIRIPDGPEDCCIVRTVNAGEEPSSVIQSISRTALQADGAVWTVTDVSRNAKDWNGAAVVSPGDGAVLGIFLSQDSEAVIVPFTTAFPEME